MLSHLRRIPALSITRPFQTRSLGSHSWLLTPAQLNALPKASTRILDVTWFMPNSPRNAREEFAKTRIPGAQYLDLDEVASDNEMGLKHMMPSSQQFREACGKFAAT